MKSESEGLEKVPNRNSIEYVNLLRQIWKEGQQRVPASILEERKVDEENANVKPRKPR